MRFIVYFFTVRRLFATVRRLACGDNQKDLHTPQKEVHP